MVCVCLGQIGLFSVTKDLFHAGIYEIIFIVTRKVSLELSSLQAAQADVWPSVIFVHTVLLLEIAVQDQVLRTQNAAHRAKKRGNYARVTDTAAVTHSHKPMLNMKHFNN